MSRYRDLERTLRRAERLKDRAQALASRARDVPPFGDWLKQVSPELNWDWPHLVHLRGHLQDLTDRVIDRLAIFMAPRHGKSAMSTLRYPVWLLERNPTERIILGAYNQTFAEKLSRQARKIARKRIAISKERSAVKQWETDAGGGMRATSTNSPPTGEGFSCLIVDDPVRDREQADSEAYRERCWEWYSQDLLTRAEPGSAIVLIQTRWHADDLAGRILASDEAHRWRVVSLPALAEENDPLGRAVGEALCPERFPAEALEKIRRTMGDHAFSALYQQRATPKEGHLFKLAWFDRYRTALPSDARLVRYWDTAGTAGGGCYTAGVLMARDKEGAYYVADVRRAQLDAHEREKWLLATAEEDRDTYGLKVEIGLEEQGGSSGREAAQATLRHLAGFTCFSERPCTSKEVRAGPLAAQMGAGNVYLLRGAWNRMFREECCAFPQGKYKDMVDAASGAFSRLQRGTGSVRVRL